MNSPLPSGFGIVMDASAKELRPGVWFGGSPARVLRLTPAGRDAWLELSAATVITRRTGQLARRLTDAGLAHPRPPRTASSGEVTVLVPAFGRPDALGRCLAALGTEHAVLVVDDGSADAVAIAGVASRFGARVVRRERNGGPAAARNTGLAEIGTEFVALLDSDCVPPPDWLGPLLAHLGDPLVGAVAPRIRGRADSSWSGRYTTARGSLDLGPQPGIVAPANRVSYVPTAALVARRSALLEVARDDNVFDPTLRVGEDVDLVWRLSAAGWRVRYDPSVQVAHQEPVGWIALLTRRFRYGTSAALLAQRHPRAAVPLVLHLWPALTVGALLARRPVPALVAFGVTLARTSRTLSEADVPTQGVVRAMASAVGQTGLGVGRYATQFASPVLAFAVLRRGSRGRRLAAASLLLGPALTTWVAHRRELDPFRFTAAYLADEIAYGAGVWTGSVRHRTLAVVRPRVVWRPLQNVSLPKTPMQTINDPLSGDTA